MEQLQQWSIEIRPTKQWLDLDLKDLWRYKDLYWMYVKRDIVTQYKQTILGPLWFLIQPALTTIHKILRPENLHFGYRTVKEILDYIQQSQSTWAQQGDFCMASKILPKLRGGEDKLGSILPVFLAFAITGETEQAKLHETAGDLVADILDARQLPGILKRMNLESPVYPLTSDKLFRMTRQLLETGLASFF